MPARRAVKPGKPSSARRSSKKAVSSVTKKVRMTKDDARRLTALARALGTSESEILRKGIEWADLAERRRRGIEGLIAMAIRDGPEPPKIHWEGKVWPDEDRA